MHTSALHLGSRIWLIGAPGSGKSTLARALAGIRDCPHIDLDEIHWTCDWQRLTPEAFRTKLSGLLQQGRFVVDGCYEVVTDLLLESCDTILWLDLPLHTTWMRVLRRTIRRLITREVICNGNRQTLRSLWGPDSILLYAIRQHTVSRQMARTMEAAIRHRQQGRAEGFLCFRSRSEILGFCKALQA